MNNLELALESETGTSTSTDTNPKSGFYPKWKVILHNDNETPAQFVVIILNKFFNKNSEDAYRIMAQTHKDGIGLAGIYPKEQAEFRTDQTINLARTHKFPLKLTIEKE